MSNKVYFRTPSGLGTIEYETNQDALRAVSSRQAMLADAKTMFKGLPKKLHPKSNTAFLTVVGE